MLAEHFLAFWAIALAVYLVGFLSYPVMMAIVESVRRGR